MVLLGVLSALLIAGLLVGAMWVAGTVLVVNGALGVWR